MGDVANHLAEPALYTFKAKEYRVSPWTYEVQGKFERYLEKAALDAYHKAAPHLSTEDAEKALASIMRDVAAGVYTFGGEAVGKALSSPHHVRYLWFLCLKKNHPEVTREETDLMIKEDYPGVIRAMNMANGGATKKDPNAEGGEGEATPPSAP